MPKIIEKLQSSRFHGSVAWVAYHCYAIDESLKTRSYGFREFSQIFLAGPFAEDFFGIKGGTF